MDEDMSKEDKLLMEKMRQFITKHFGIRCPKYCVGCATCEAWSAFYVLFNITDESEIAWEEHLKRRTKVANK